MKRVSNAIIAPVCFALSIGAAALAMASCAPSNTKSSGGLTVSRESIPSFSETVYEPHGYDFMLRVPEIMADSYCDSIYIKYGDWDCVIDGGSSSDAPSISEALRTYCTDHKLDLYIGTHAHNDHMGIFYGGTASNNVFKDGGVKSFGYIIDSGSSRDASFMNYYIKNVRPWMIANGGKYIPVHAFFNEDAGYKDFYGQNVINITGDPSNTSYLSSIAEGDVYMTVMNSGVYLPPNTSYDESPNLRSVGVCLASFNQRFIMCGDAEGETELGFKKNHSYWDGSSRLWKEENDVYLKADHHGSDTHNSNNNEWISWCQPDHVFVSAAIVEGNRSKYGVSESQHPYPTAIRRFEKLTYDIHWNGINGTYTYSNSKEDRSTTKFQGSPKKIPYYHNGEAVTGEENVTLPMSKWCQSEKYSSVARTSPNGHDMHNAFNPLGSFTNIGFDYDGFIERNCAGESIPSVNELGELYDRGNHTYC